MSVDTEPTFSTGAWKKGAMRERPYGSDIPVFPDIPGVAGTPIPQSYIDLANGKDAGATKPSNPKDAMGSRKAPLDLVPDTLEIFAAEAFLEGGLKYGRYNWRLSGVRSSIYYSAIKRHLKKWWNGQDRDLTTGVRHLVSVLACVGIILDAELYGKLTDDRPPSPDRDRVAHLIDLMEARVAQLKDLFKNENPVQFTIADSQET